MSDRSDRNDRQWQDRGDEAYDRFTKRPWWTSFKVIAVAIVAVIALGLLGTYIGLFGDWAKQPARITGVENVRKTWAEAYQLDRDSTAQARIVCSTAQTPGLADTVSGPAILAQINSYNRIWSQYSQLVSNKLEGGLVLPPNLPARNTTLGEMLERVQCPDDVIAKIPGAQLE